MDVIELIQFASKARATDLNLVAGSPPLLRVNGDIEPIKGHRRLTPDDVAQALEQLATAAEREIFRKDMELDFGYTVEGIGRLRCNAAVQFNGISLAIRLLPIRIPTIEDLGLPKIYKKLVEEPRGLLLVTGPTDSGKSTTLATMVHHLNTTGSYNIITVEDPIEYVHQNAKSAVSQRQIGTHTTSFAQALKYVLRQNPDVILVGEIRDLETAAAVLSIAETGHLVLSTSHAPSAYQAIERIVDMFPVYERHLSETRLASVLIGVVCQTLVPRADESGRVAAVEIMLANPAVRSLIREGKIYQLPSVIRTNREIGMVSLDESLADLYIRSVITSDTAVAFCRDQEELTKLMYRITPPPKAPGDSKRKS